MLMLSLPSAFQTTLVAPPWCSCLLSWWQNPYGHFWWAPPASFFLYIYLLLVPHVTDSFRAERPEGCSLVLSDLLCSSSPLLYPNNSSFLSPLPHLTLSWPWSPHSSESFFLSTPAKISPKGHPSVASERVVFKEIWPARCLMHCGLEEMKQLDAFVPFARHSNSQLIIMNNRWKCVWCIS